MKNTAILLALLSLSTNALALAKPLEKVPSANGRTHYQTTTLNSSEALRLYDGLKSTPVRNETEKCFMKTLTLNPFRSVIQCLKYDNGEADCVVILEVP
jgi:hypothetical protein